MSASVRLSGGVPDGRGGDRADIPEGRRARRLGPGRRRSRGHLNRYADRIHGFCCSILREAEEAADATQETFISAAGRLGQLREPASLKAWLFAIARNEATRHGRARQRQSPTATGDDRASNRPGPDDLASRADAAVVWEAAAGLSQRDQVLLELSRVWRDKSWLTRSGPPSSTPP